MDPTLIDSATSLDIERSFRGDSTSSWKQLFVLLADREGIRDDRVRSVAPTDFVSRDREESEGTPLSVRLQIRRAGRDVSTLCGIDTVALHHLAGHLDIKWSVMQLVADSSPMALACLVADVWRKKVGEGTLRWRIVDSTVRAIVTADYTPLNDIAVARLLERPLTSLGVSPARALRSGTETRIEFVLNDSSQRQRGAHRPGIVLRNSETGHAMLTLSPGLVRHNGTATRLSEPTLEYRHVIANRDALAERLVAALPSLLNAARATCDRWSKIRTVRCSPQQLATASISLERALGKKLRDEIMTSFGTRQPGDRTPSGLFATVAGAIRDLSPWKRTETDLLLSALLTDTVVKVGTIAHASAI